MLWIEVVNRSPVFIALLKRHIVRFFVARRVFGQIFSSEKVIFRFLTRNAEQL